MSSPYSNFPDTPNAKRKRKSAALSCAECRRLKLRCSRVFPCSNCVKRGCSAICPEGSLTTGKGNRFVLANTEVLHDKIGQLANRVRHLEDALHQTHSAISNDAHPLLDPELLKIKNPLERERDEPQPNSSDNTKEATEVIDAIGSLSISDHGRAAFFGKTANSWYLLQNEEGEDDHDGHDCHELPMPSDIPWLSHAFPFATPTSRIAEATRTTLLSFLPRASMAKHISDLYFRHAAFLYTPIPENEFHDSIFRRIYHPDLVTDNGSSSHRLAVLFMVLALGTLMDLDKPSHSQESKQYYQLARAALSLDSVFEDQSITAIQALFLMCHFMFLSDIEGPRWALMGLVVKLAQGIGLHRDSGKWNLDTEETHKRRVMMWEIYTYDSWQSLTFGRPPSFSMAHIDCQLAYDTTKNEAGELEMTFAAWKHRFSSQCLSIVQDQAFGARTPSYKAIQQLDKQVRGFYIPPSLQVPGFGSRIGKEVEQPSIQLTMQRYLAFAIREITLFYMHRGFFARAVEDHPEDPMGSKYSQSVLAAYDSACSFVGLIESLYSQYPALTERMWFLFTHVFSCAIVLGAIAKSQVALAPSALSHLESAYHLFEQVSKNPRASKIIPIIQNLRRQAQAVIGEDRNRPPVPDGFRATYFGSIKNEIQKLSSLGGMTRLVSRRKNSSHRSPGNDRGSQSPTSVSPPQTHARSSSLPLQESPSTPSAIAHSSQWQPSYNQYQPTHTPTYPQAPAQLDTQMYNGHVDVQMAAQYYPNYNNPSPPGMDEWYSQTNMMPVQSPVDGYYPAADHLGASWQNLVAQYKTH